MSEGKVYFAQFGGEKGPIKIGYSTQVKVRIQQVNTWAPQPIVLLASASGTQQDETSIHRMLSEHRLRGEWFKPSKELRTLIAHIEAGRALKELIDDAYRIIASPPKVKGKHSSRGSRLFSEWLATNNLSDFQAAEKIGMSRAFVNMLRNGQSRVSLKTAVVIDDFTGGEVPVAAWVKDRSDGRVKKRASS